MEWKRQISIHRHRQNTRHVTNWLAKFNNLVNKVTRKCTAKVAVFVVCSGFVGVLGMQQLVDDLPALSVVGAGFVDTLTVSYCRCVVVVSLCCESVVVVFVCESWHIRATAVCRRVRVADFEDLRRWIGTMTVEPCSLSFLMQCFSQGFKVFLKLVFRVFYAALLHRRGRILRRTLSVRLSVRPSRYRCHR